MIEPAVSPDFTNNLEDVLDQFELAWSADPNFLKSTVESNALHFDMKGVAELVRADIDRRYTANCALELPRYFEWFPKLGMDTTLAQAIAFEDYRSRKTRGLDVSRERWEWIPNIQSVGWFQGIHQSSILKLIVDSENGKPNLVPSPSKRDVTEPRVGEQFGDFQLIATLGTGAFSEVFLATQPSLASRYVALKVVRKTLDEPEHLARLQHTGIVPIYSLHRLGPYSVLCMPYFGAATLADWISDDHVTAQRNGQSLIGTVQQAQTRISSFDTSESESSTETVPTDLDRIRVWNASGAQPLARLRSMDEKGCLLWLARRIASALAHAHERDVIHGDLKPANVLLKSDGEPALIDFNLARRLEEKPSTHVGGTLPYMSPEQLQMLLGRRLHLSAASDIYSLGMILYQIAEGRMPFPAPLSSAEIDISSAIQFRKDKIRFSNSMLPFGVKAIISKCLQLDPQDRYVSGTELLEDLDCEAANLPLVHATESFLQSRIPKLIHRYPRLFSVVPVLVVATVMVTLLLMVSMYWWQQSSLWSSHDSLMNWTSQVSDQIPNLLEGTDENIQHSFSTMDQAIHTMTGNQPHYGTIAKLNWLPPMERAEAENDFYNDVLVLSGLASEHRSQLLPKQRSQLDEWLTLLGASNQLNRSRTVEQLRSSHGGPFLKSTEGGDSLSENLLDTPLTDGEKILRARAFALNGFPLRAIETLSEVTPRPAIRSLYWITAGDAQRLQGHSEDAVLAYGIAINEAPESTVGYSRRSQLFAEMRKWNEAERDCTTLISMNPRSALLFAERARLRESAGKIEDAIADMDEAIDLNPKANRYYLFRSRLGQKTKNHAKAKEDYRFGVSLTPETTEDWISRALAQLPRYPDRAMADLKQAEFMEPNRFEVLQNQAHILSEYLKDEEGAIRVLTSILKYDSQNVWARVDRCVLLARAGKKEEVVAEIKDILDGSHSVAPVTYYQIACSHALLAAQHPECRNQAFSYLSKAILGGYGQDLLETDQDLNSLRMDLQFKALLEVTRLAKESSSYNENELVKPLPPRQ